MGGGGAEGGGVPSHLKGGATWAKVGGRCPIPSKRGCDMGEGGEGVCVCVPSHLKAAGV